MQASPVDHLLMNAGGLGFAAMSGLGGASNGGSGANSNFMILDPLNILNNTTKNSFLTRDILK